MNRQQSLNIEISCGSVGDQLPPLSAKYPWFAAQNFEETGEQIFYTLDKQLSHYRCRIPELVGRQIRAYIHGWAILSDRPYDVMWSLWNPLTSKLIRLPPLIYKHKDTPFSCLSAPPDDLSSVFLLTIIDKPTFVFCRLDRKRKKSRWTAMSYAKQLKSISGEEDGLLISPACCNGKVYALTYRTRDTYVMQVDIVVKDKEVVISISPFVAVVVGYVYNRFPLFYSIESACHFLKGSSTELFYIILGFRDESCKTIGDIYLFKLDMTSLIWEEMKDLKDAIFFMEPASDNSVFYWPTVASELGGYIHILGEMGKMLYSYHVKDRTISQSYMPSVVRESQVSAWALLENRLEDDHASKQEKEKDGEIVVRSNKGDENKSNSMEGESLLLNIPFHLLENIMEICVGVEYLNFRATCKRCYLAAPPIQWSSKTTPRLQEYSLVSPWLMVFEKDRCIITFIDPLSGDEYFVRTPQQLRDYQIYCSGYGWLLMFKVSGLLTFFNPFTSDILKLPVVPCLDTFCFSSPPTSPDCIVVGFTTGDCHVYIHCVAREQLWRTLSLDFGGVDPYSFHLPTFYGRDIYALCNEGLINIFRNMGEEDYSWEHVTARASNSCKSPAQYYLAICDHHRLLVIVGEFGESVEVFNLNDNEELEKIDDIGNHVIFISGSTCLCIEAKASEMKNKVYFSRLSVSGKIVFYSLETCKYHTFNGKNNQESFEDLLNTKHHCYPYTWIEPSWS